jgi:hypothetical protein
MAIGTDELALRNLVEDRPTAVTAQEGADLGDLVLARKVIPCHGRGVKGTTTIGAGLSCLELSIPLRHLEMSRTLLNQAQLACASVISRVVAASAVLAPRLMASPSAMKLLEQLLSAA